MRALNQIISKFLFSSNISSKFNLLNFFDHRSQSSNESGKKNAWRDFLSIHTVLSSSHEIEAPPKFYKLRFCEVRLNLWIPCLLYTYVIYSLMFTPVLTGPKSILYWVEATCLSPMWQMMTVELTPVLSHIKMRILVPLQSSQSWVS